MVSRNVLGDVGLALLGVVTVAAAGYVLLRDPLPPDASAALPVPSAAAPAEPPAPAVLPTPSAGPVDLTVLRSPTTAAGHVVAAATDLGWRVRDAPLDRPGDLAGQEVVLLQAGQDDSDDVVEAVTAVREQAASARLVVVGPLVPVSAGDPALRDAVEAAGGELLEPAALGWLQDVPDAFAPSGSLTPDGAQVLGGRLADALREP